MNEFPSQSGRTSEEKARALNPFNIRLLTGLVLMLFLAMHLTNHALNLISLKTAEDVRLFFNAIWNSPLGTILLYGSLIVHSALGLAALYRRRTLRMPVRELAQLVLGLAFPLLIVNHVVSTRVVAELYDVNASYESVVRSLWLADPVAGAWQAVAAVVIWSHGCLGIHFWLRYRHWYHQVASWLLVAAVLVPVVALLGFHSAGREVAGLAQSSQLDDTGLVESASELKTRIADAINYGFGAIIVGILFARRLRERLRRNSLVEISYAGGAKVRVPTGCSVLEASRLGGIPHYSACGGRGRCSTCRVRVLEGLSDQPHPESNEAATLRRIEPSDDVRLACQLRPTAPLTVAPLLVPAARHHNSSATISGDPGREHVLAVMFCDLRGFTSLSDQRLPYDIVFLLNRYFETIGKAVEDAGGRLDKFIGDGALAVFGLNTSPREACRQALTAAKAILTNVQTLSHELSSELRDQLNVVISIHVGPVIVGSMGYGTAMGLTVVGKTVNVGSRLERAAKELGAAVIVSEAVAKLSRLDFGRFEIHELAIRGGTRPLRVRIVPPGASLPE